jgi:phosphohistidine phosphatase
MRIYLVQHAKAKSDEQDPSRQLNEEGIEEIKKVSDFLKHLKIKVDRIFHSEKLRAKQTALILNEGLISRHEPSKMKGLNPNDDPAVINNFIISKTDDLMFVGHLPFMNKLLNLMTTGTVKTDVMSFVQGAVACLEKNVETNRFQLLYIIRPDII